MLRGLIFKTSYKSLFFLISSSILLILSFPKYDYWLLAWIGLIPLLLALDGKTYKQAFGIAYLCGVLFFTGTVYWIGHVTIVGAILLILYLALYFGLFGLGYILFSRYPVVIKIFLLSSLWVALEYTRAHALSGFGWASLGQSQYKNVWIIQMAEMTGMLGVSFLVVMVNCFLKEWIERKQWVLMGLPILILVSVLGYGIFRMAFFNKQELETIKVGVVQANISQQMKWQESLWASIIDKHFVLTKEAVKEHPDLIVWPETAFPGFLLKDKKYLQQLKDLAKEIHTPLLFGSVTDDHGKFYNSAVMLSSKGVIVGRYDKKHLVPFGEYIPLRTNFPFLSDIIPVADFSSGKEYTVFSEMTSHKKNKKFSALICFEDTIGRLARKFAMAGAGLFINITNDAWFMDTSAPFMHLQASVFRTVENRRGLVRATNTGVSGFVDMTGKIINVLQNAQGEEVFISGYRTQKMQLNYKKTFYTKYGDVFAFICFGCIMGAILMIIVRTKLWKIH